MTPILAVVTGYTDCKRITVKNISDATPSTSYIIFFSFSLCHFPGLQSRSLYRSPTDTQCFRDLQVPKCGVLNNSHSVPRVIDTSLSIESRIGDPSMFLIQWRILGSVQGHGSKIRLVISEEERRSYRRTASASNSVHSRAYSSLSETLISSVPVDHM